MTHICVGHLTIIGSDNGLLPVWRKAIIWTNAGILLIGALGTNFSELSIIIQTFLFKKNRLKVSPAKWRPLCVSLNELTPCVNITSNPFMVFYWLAEYGINFIVQDLLLPMVQVRYRQSGTATNTCEWPSGKTCNIPLLGHTDLIQITIWSVVPIKKLNSRNIVYLIFQLRVKNLDMMAWFVKSFTMKYMVTSGACLNNTFTESDWEIPHYDD